MCVYANNFPLSVGYQRVIVDRQEWSKEVIKEGKFYKEKLSDFRRARLS